MSVTTEIDNRAKLLTHIIRKEIVDDTRGRAAPEVVEQAVMARAMMALVAVAREKCPTLPSMKPIMFGIVAMQFGARLDQRDARTELLTNFNELWREAEGGCMREAPTHDEAFKMGRDLIIQAQASVQDAYNVDGVDLTDSLPGMLSGMLAGVVGGYWAAKNRDAMPEVARAYLRSLMDDLMDQCIAIDARAQPVGGA